MAGKGASGKDNGMWRSDLDIDLIVDMYSNQNMSIRAIGKELGIDHGVIRRRIESLNLPIERKPRSDKAKDNTPAKNKLFYKYRMQANRRGIEFKLKYHFFLDLIKQECFYCGATNSAREVTPSGHILEFNGIDRVDNTSGYVEHNVVPCCKTCNQMKSDLDYSVFTNQIKCIYERMLKQ